MELLEIVRDMAEAMREAVAAAPADAPARWTPILAFRKEWVVIRGGAGRHRTYAAYVRCSRLDPTVLRSVCCVAGRPCEDTPEVLDLRIPTLAAAAATHIFIPQEMLDELRRDITSARADLVVREGIPPAPAPRPHQQLDLHVRRLDAGPASR